MAKRIDFAGFIYAHDEVIFGEGLLKKGASQYKKQINALDIKMNELIQKGHPMTKDPVMLLGLFDMALNEFGTTVKTDLTLYRDDFIALINKGMKGE